MPRIAILSDIHGNIRALEAVMADLAQNGGADRIISLGDVIGYGPRPLDCLEVAKRHFEFSLRGNHEQAVLYGAKDFNEMALRAINWTRLQIMPDYERANALQMENWTWVANTLEKHQEGSILFVHGAPQDPIDEYILPMDIDPLNKRYGPKLEQAFRLTPPGPLQRGRFIRLSHPPEGGPDRPRPPEAAYRERRVRRAAARRRQPRVLRDLRGRRPHVAAHALRHPGHVQPGLRDLLARPDARRATVPGRIAGR